MRRHPALAAAILAVIVTVGSAGEGLADRDNVAKPPARPAVKSSVKPEARPEVKPGVKPEAKPDAKPGAKPALRLEVKPEVKPDVKTDVMPARFDHKSLGKDDKDCARCHKTRGPEKK